MNDDKIYEELNNIEIKIDEIKVDEITKKRIKKNVQSRINKKSNKKLKYLVASIAMIIFLPVSYQGISEVKKYFFYENGVGIIEIKNDEINRLIEPIAFGKNGEYILKNVVGKNEGIDVGLWVNNDINIKIDDSYIKLEDGTEVKSSVIGEGRGGENNYFNLFFPTSGSVKKFDLFIGNESIKVDIVGIDRIDDYKKLGQYDKNKDIILGGSKYNINDKTYISFWNNLSLEHNNILVRDINKDDIIVKDEEGNKLDINNSLYNGMQTEFILDKKYNKKLDVTINKIELDYSFDESSKGNKIELKLPKKNTKELLKESLELDYFGAVDIVSIESIDDEVRVEFNLSKLNKDGINVSMLSMIRNGAGAIGSDGKSNCFISINKNDLSLGERFNNKLKLEISKVSFYINQQWNFIIE